MKLLLLFCMLFTKPVQSPDTGLVEIRSLYAQAANDKSASEKLAAVLSKIDTTSLPVFICYKGASEMIKAKYLINPLNKMGKFNASKTLIELAVKHDPENIEVRFVRFCIQVNLPAFLKYDNIADDKKYLIDHVNHVDDNDLKNNIINFLSNPKYCTAEEIERIKGQ